MGKKLIKCTNCKKEFLKYIDNRNIKNYYCSTECKYEHVKKIKSELVKCETCGTEFWANKLKLKKGKGRFCSNKCKHESYTSDSFYVTQICTQCAKSYKSYKSENRGKNNFCSTSCYNTYRKNEYGLTKYRKVAFDAYEHECEICKIKLPLSVYDVHHIDENRKNNDVLNLIILCPNHHKHITVGWAKIDEHRNYIKFEERKIKPRKQHSYKHKKVSIMERINDLKDININEYGIYKKMSDKWKLSPGASREFITKIKRDLNNGLSYDTILKIREKNCGIKKEINIVT